MRNCPTKAIRIEHGQAMVMEEDCICCGRCVIVCAQNAKKIASAIEPSLEILASSEDTYAILAPSFPAAFPQVKPNQVISALYRLGFKHIWSAAVGADMISVEYRRLVSKDSVVTLISTPCPALVSYIEKHQPDLLMFLAPIVSPMIATGRRIRAHHNPDAKIIFIGPCIAKKNEIADVKVQGVIDEVLTFKELEDIFSLRNIQPETLPEKQMDGPMPKLGGIFPVSGGLLRTAHLQDDILENDIIVTEGSTRVLDVLQQVEEGKVQARFLDLLFCKGCIDGPAIQNELSVFERKNIVANYVRQQLEKVRAEADDAEDVNLERRFTKQEISRPMPSEEEIKAILKQVNKTKKEDELNCGACGYATCREKAIAVYQGRAELEMCLPYLIDRLEIMNRELIDAQHRMVSAARLASMGELSAGVAHEINNPLAGALNYIKLMQRKLKGEQVELDIGTYFRYLETMEGEISRVSGIVRTLLDFSRPSEPAIEKVLIPELFQKILILLHYQISLQDIEIKEEYHDCEVPIRADFKQIQQVLMNILINAAQATPKGGSITLRCHRHSDSRYMQMEIEDTGCGMSKENLARIFDPFFTTKEKERGTGLGLSVAYSIILKHQGTIDVESEEGVGSKFTIKIPVYRDEDVPKD
ncbi:GHKL domain-containing protein [candidate division KSB1 bacterium]|nr:GHKL domain-containing protein [candidate division KSB1 bacterium]